MGSTDFFNAKWINNKELLLNTLLYVSVRYTCYCSIMLLFGNCIIVCHICRLGQFWLKEHLIPSMEPLKWRNIHDLYTTDSLIRTLCSVPSVSVLERFDCILFLPTTFIHTHTHTHDPRPLPTTHDSRHLAKLPRNRWLCGLFVGFTLFNWLFEELIVW